MIYRKATDQLIPGKKWDKTNQRTTIEIEHYQSMINQQIRAFEY